MLTALYYTSNDKKGLFSSSQTVFSNIDNDDNIESATAQTNKHQLVYAPLSHNGIRIRTAPSADASLATEHRLQTREGVYGTGLARDGWVEIYLDDTGTGWISESLVETNGTTDPEIWISENDVSLIPEFIP